MVKKGFLSYLAYRRFGRLPDEGMQHSLEGAGWKFQTISGSDGEGISNKLNRVIHPDGKPLDGMGSPGYLSGSDDPLILPEYKAEREKRWQDFRDALARAPH